MAVVDVADEARRLVLAAQVSRDGADEGEGGPRARRLAACAAPSTGTSAVEGPAPMSRARHE